MTPRVDYPVWAKPPADSSHDTGVASFTPRSTPARVAAQLLLPSCMRPRPVSFPVRFPGLPGPVSGQRSPAGHRPDTGHRPVTGHRSPSGHRSPAGHRSPVAGWSPVTGHRTPVGHRSPVSGRSPVTSRPPVTGRSPARHRCPLLLQPWYGQSPEVFVPDWTLPERLRIGRGGCRGASHPGL